MLSEELGQEAKSAKNNSVAVDSPSTPLSRSVVGTPETADAFTRSVLQPVKRTNRIRDDSSFRRVEKWLPTLPNAQSSDVDSAPECYSPESLRGSPSAAETALDDEFGMRDSQSDSSFCSSCRRSTTPPDSVSEISSPRLGMKRRRRNSETEAIAISTQQALETCNLSSKKPRLTNDGLRTFSSPLKAKSFSVLDRTSCQTITVPGELLPHSSLLKQKVGDLTPSTFSTKRLTKRFSDQENR